uniref:Retrotransposon Copia-like N-terminal domain-containing protein n=2 Tax=Fagus sylvatica TaxID=28930 RepID=A0A2N9EEU4_FAGSY
MAFEITSTKIVYVVTPLDDPPPSSPYYIHANDNSSLMLVNQPLTGDNFHSWFRSMAMGLTIKNKLGFVGWKSILVCTCVPSCSCGAMRQGFLFDKTRGMAEIYWSIECPYVQSTALLCNTESAESTPAKQGFQKRDKPTCSHCGLIGHTMEKCYKLHRYPPGYKTKGKGPVANQVFVTNFGANVVAVTNEMSHFQLSQIQAQCQQLLAVLNTKSLLPNTPKPSTSNVTYQAMANTTSSSSLPIHSMSGLHPLEDDWTG